MMLREIIEANVSPVPEVGCWMWMGSIGTRGYGQMSWQGRTHRAHRLSFVAWCGDIPEGLVVHHKCNNRWCVNPDHLEATTHKRNVLLGTSPTAVNARKTHCPAGHPLSGANVYERNCGARGCRECTRVQQMDRYFLKHGRKPRKWVACKRGHNMEEHAYVSPSGSRRCNTCRKDVRRSKV